MRHAREARNQYRADADRDWSTDEIIIHADMMVTVIRIIPIREAVLTLRTICYNDIFSTIMPTENTSRTSRKPLQRSTQCVRAQAQGACGPQFRRSRGDVRAAHGNSLPGLPGGSHLG